MSLLIVGTVAFDTIETPFGKADMVIGGSAQYASYAASYFVNDINLVSIVGDDFPQSELDELEKQGGQDRRAEGGKRREILFLVRKVSCKFKRQGYPHD